MWYKIIFNVLLWNNTNVMQFTEKQEKLTETTNIFYYSWLPIYMWYKM